MDKRFCIAGAALALAVTACSGAGTTLGTPNAVVPQSVRRVAAIAAATPGANSIANPGFETGSLSPWTSCGSTSGVSISTATVHGGTYSALIGAIKKPEVNGTAGVCQMVTVPTNATLTFWVYEGTNDSISYVDQEADVENTSGTVLAQLYKEAVSSGGWVEKTFSLSSYAGQTVQLYFGVKGNGYSKDYVYEYLDDVTLSGPSSSPSPSPSASPTGSPTSSPTASPTSTPTAGPYACNNTQFLTDQSEFAAGSISADQLVDVCGAVTQVLAKKTTSSGTHGYFYVAMPSGYQIEIVSNLDAMAEASTDKPPTTWPWVAVGDYVYVQGRYYYDNASSQGIDWTEDDTDSSWSHTGYVAVCGSTGANCAKYW